MPISSMQAGEIIRNSYDATLGGVKVWSGGKAFRVSTEVVRPADATAYATGDSISSSASAPAVILLSGVCDAGGSAMFTGMGILTDEVYTTAITVRAHVYSVEVTPGNDNLALPTTYASETGYCGSYDVSVYGNSTGDASKGMNVTDRIVASSATGNFWVKLEARSAIATASGQKITVIAEGIKL